MNIPILLASCLLLTSTNANNSSSIPHVKNEFIGIVDVMNQIKNFLDEGTTSYKITWDTSLALYSSERIDSCPTELSEGEIFVKTEDVADLFDKLNSTDSFSLSPLPTIAIFQNKAARIHLDIGSRIGCAHNNCSSGNDLLCVFDNRKHAQDRLGKYRCVIDETFPNLCNEQPIDYWSMDHAEFEWHMKRWNEQRRAVAKKFGATGMNELCWSDDAVRFASQIGSKCDPIHADFRGTHFHMHPRTLDPLGTLWMFTHDDIDASLVHGNTTIEMFAPQQKMFGCAPLDPSRCKDYSYICVLGPDWYSSNPFTIPTGKLCGECPDSCRDGLCVTVQENIPEVQDSSELENVNDVSTETLTKVYSGITWKFFAVLVCFIGASGVALLLLYAVVTNHYHF